MLLFRELVKIFEVNEIHPVVVFGMARPPETFGKVAAVFGVTRQAVHKWKHNGAPFYSADALLTWLNNREGTRVLDNFRHRCPVLRADLERALEWPVFWPEKSGF